MSEKFTVGQVEDEARLILLDTYTDAFRFEPKEVYAAMKDGLLRLRREQPASRYVGGILVALEFTDSSNNVHTDLPAITNTDDTDYESARLWVVSMESRWKEAIVYYVVHRMYQKDDPDTKNDALSTRYFEMYTAAKGG